MCNCRNCWWFGTDQCDQEAGSENCCYEPVTEEDSDNNETADIEEGRIAFRSEWNKLMGSDTLYFSFNSTHVLKALNKREYE